MILFLRMRRTISRWTVSRKLWCQALFFSKSSRCAFPSNSSNYLKTFSSTPYAGLSQVPFIIPDADGTFQYTYSNCTVFGAPRKIWYGKKPFVDMKNINACWKVAVIGFDSCGTNPGKRLEGSRRESSYLVVVPSQNRNPFKIKEPCPSGSKLSGRSGPGKPWQQGYYQAAEW